MSDVMEDLGRRATACAGWRWMPGIRAAFPGRYGAGRVASDGTHVRGDRGLRTAVGTALPDLSDPATMGCLLALVREAWGESLVQVEPSRAEAEMQWVVWVSDDVRFYAPTEAGALVAALEAAP